MQWIPIAGGSFAFIGLVMMVIALVMLMRGGKRQVRVVLPSSGAGKVAPSPKAAAPPPPPAAKPEPPKPEPPKAAAPPPPPPPPAPEPEHDPRVSEEGTRIAMIPAPTPLAPPPIPVPEPDPRVSEEGTRIAMIPAPTPLAPPPAAPPPPEPTVVHAMMSPADEEESQATTAISPDEMADFRSNVESRAAKSHGHLVGISGVMEGRELKIDEQGFVIGRDQRTAQLVINDPRISKRHVWVGVREGEVWAVDVGSTNGTYVNVPRSERITEVRLEPGDVIILAEDAARFEYRKG